MTRQMPYDPLPASVYCSALVWLSCLGEVSGVWAKDKAPGNIVQCRPTEDGIVEIRHDAEVKLARLIGAAIQSRVKMSEVPKSLVQLR